METQNFEIISAKSKINWIGRKVTGAHDGTIAIKHGGLTFNEGKLTGGKFIIDTTSIEILDVTDPATNAQFAGHLESADFFNTVQYPEATLVIIAAAQKDNDHYHIHGELTIKDLTHPVQFDAHINNAGETLTASGKLVIDRTKYDMRFRSGNFFKDLGDTLIYNDFELNIILTAKTVDTTVLA